MIFIHVTPRISLNDINHISLVLIIVLNREQNEYVSRNEKKNVAK